MCATPRARQCKGCASREAAQALPNVSVPVDLAVTGIVDEARRNQLTQHHTATHLINAAARNILGPHIWQAGAHKSMEMARLDVTHYQSITDDELRRIEETANDYARQDIRLLIPTTYMNRSGQAVGPLANFFKIPVEAILVAHDELLDPIEKRLLGVEVGGQVDRGVGQLLQPRQLRQPPRNLGQARRRRYACCR